MRRRTDVGETIWQIFKKKLKVPLQSHSSFPDFSHLNLTTVRGSYLRQMMGSFKHFHEESVDRCVTDQLKEEQVLQALQADGPQRRQPQEELGEPVRGGGQKGGQGRWALDGWRSKQLLRGAFTFPAALGISVCSRPPVTRRPSLWAAPPRWIWKVLLHLQDNLWRLASVSGWDRKWGPKTGRARAPGLKRTMARRQPSSVLSICISLILLTSSVRTLNHDRLSRLEGWITYNTARARGRNSRLPVKDGPDFCTLHILPVTNDSAFIPDAPPPHVETVWHERVHPYLSKMAPTPALFALSRCSSEASRTPSLELMERWENDAMSSSFQPDGYDTITGGGVTRRTLKHAAQHENFLGFFC